MESYCVIRFKDKQQKHQVLTQLNDLDLDFTVTTDLKKILSERVNVNAPESSVPTRSPPNSTRISIVTESDNLSRVTHPINDFVTESPSNHIPPSTQSMNDESNLVQHSTTYPSTTINHVDTPISGNTNPQNIGNMEDYGTYIPYLERPVEIKKEEIEDEIRSEEQEVKEQDEEMMIDLSNDELISGPTDEQIMADQVETPSLSATRSSGRAKRVNYKNSDDSDDEYTPPTKQTKKKTPAKDDKKAACNKCGKTIDDNYAAKLLHVRAPSHTNIAKFKCVVGACRHGTIYQSHMKEHLKTNHPTRPGFKKGFEAIQLTRDQSIELETMIRECFGSSENGDDKCQVCWQNVGGNSSGSLSMQQDHALNHVDFMVYKCMNPRCTFESRTKVSMIRHLSHLCKNWAKNVAKEERYSRIELAREKEMELEGMFGKCFPIPKQNGNTS